MPRAKRKSGRTNGPSRRGARASQSRRRSSKDAIELLKADHREVEGYFEQFKKARGEDRKADLTEKICTALKIHTTIEEEIFYPAFLDATDETEVHHEAEVEHEGAKKLIATIEQSGQDEYLDARIEVLSEMIRHHVNEEEKRDGMFAKARASQMDLEDLGERLKERKQQLTGERGSEGTFLETLRIQASRYR